jgi:CHASE3 domain sensor protein
MNATVRQRIVLGFSSVILLMAALCAFAYLQLRGIATQTTALQDDSLPGLYIIGRLDSVSVETYTSIEQYLLQSDRGAMQQTMTLTQEKTAQLSDLLKQYGSTVKTTRDAELYGDIKTATAPYLADLDRILKLSPDPKTKAEGTAVLVNHAGPAYRQLRTALEAEVNFNKTNADESGRRIEDAVIRAETGILIGLLVGVLLMRHLQDAFEISETVAGQMIDRRARHCLDRDVMVDRGHSRTTRGRLPTAASAAV